jgi:hypothetical protein
MGKKLVEKETHNLIISDEVYLSAEVSEKILWMIS